MTDSIDEDDYMPRSSLPGNRSGTTARERHFIFTERDLLEFIARLRAAMPRVLFFDAHALKTKQPGNLGLPPQEIADVSARQTGLLRVVIPFRSWPAEFLPLDATDGQRFWAFQRHPGLSFDLSCGRPGAQIETVDMPPPFGRIEAVRRGGICAWFDRRDPVPVRQAQRLFSILRRGTTICKLELRPPNWASQAGPYTYYAGPDALAWSRSAPGRLLSAYRGFEPRHPFVIVSPDWTIESFRPAPRDATAAIHAPVVIASASAGDLPIARRHNLITLKPFILAYSDLADLATWIRRIDKGLVLIEDFDPAQLAMPVIRVLDEPSDRSGDGVQFLSPPPNWTPELQRVQDPETGSPRWQFVHPTGNRLVVKARTARLNWTLPRPIGAVRAHQPSHLWEIAEKAAPWRGLSSGHAAIALRAVEGPSFFEVIRIEPERVRRFRTAPSYYRVGRGTIRDVRPESDAVVAVIPWNDENPMERLEVFIRPAPDPRAPYEDPYEEVPL